MGIFNSRKFRHVQFWVISSVAGSLAALHYGIPSELISSYWIGSGIALSGAMIAFGLSDAAHAGNKK